MIIGGGFAGLIAAHMLPGHQIVEASPEPREGHKALLRFRSDMVARATGIDFTPVTVRKGVWVSGTGFTEPTVQLANWYSQKVLGEARNDRSVWNVEPVARWIAPETFHEQLVEALWSRITWGVKMGRVGIEDAARNDTLISTIPMPRMLEELRFPLERGINFKHAPITVQRFRVPNADLYQTVYFPEPGLDLYRASMTKDMLICEFVGSPDEKGVEQESALAVRALGLMKDPEPMEAVKQNYGKIAPIEEGLRKRLVAKLTEDYEIYSLGRFATWRNILLDDVVNDVFVLKRLIAASQYERKLKSI